MASITRLGKGKQPPRAVEFVDDTDGGKRKRIRLGIVTYTEAQEAKRRIEKLLTAKILNQQPDQETLRWLIGVSDTIHVRIARTGLVPPREPASQSPQLGDFLEKHIAQRELELAASSVERLRDTGKLLCSYFSEDTPIESITPNEAKDWRAHLIAGGRKEPTARLHCRNAKSFFNDALDRELIARSPFAKLKSSAIAADRDHYVTPEDALRILDACPNLQWRALFALGRLAGLRCASETHNVTWRDIDWERRRLTVYGQKTKTTRIVPIVPELMPILREAFDAAEEGSEKIVTLSRNNRHRVFENIICRAGLTPWPGLFQTLRQSCEIQLAMTCPQHAVSAWMGHSMKVSERHYLRLTDDVYDMATQSAAECAAAGQGIGSQSAAIVECNDEGQKKKTSPPPLRATTCEVIPSEADGTRTRNHRIDSPVL